MMTPQARGRVEAVVLQKPPSVPGYEPDRVDEVGEDRLGDEVVEVDADPAGFDALTAVGDLVVELAGTVQIDAQQPVSVWTGAGTAAAGLDPEQVVEQCHDVVVVQIAASGARTTNDTIDNRS